MSKSSTASRAATGLGRKKRSLPKTLWLGLRMADLEASFTVTCRKVSKMHLNLLPPTLEKF